ncbi:hypothetical protein C5F64_06275 [Photobacterium damselae subsp. damselae]|nr:hypothetical protein C5F64_06275 [Photobacterium damselae subsp. damselae]
MLTLSAKFFIYLPSWAYPMLVHEHNTISCLFYLLIDVFIKGILLPKHKPLTKLIEMAVA